MPEESHPAGSAPELQGPDLSDPRLAAFFPLLYVAWADGDLSPEETRTICSRVSSNEELGGSCGDYFGRWLDPDNPPSARDLRALLTAIRRSARELSADEKLSLTHLGVELARVDGIDVPESEIQALQEIEDALGVAGHEATRSLLATKRPEVAPTEPAAEFDVAAMTRLLDGEHHELRQRLRNLLSEERFARQYGLSTADYRERVLDWTRMLGEEGYGALAYPESCGGRDDAHASIVTFETLAYHDLSLTVKFGVQFGLFGGSILQLGTEKHHQRNLRDAGTVALPGCFAMTESGHGSNVGDIETVARYDRSTQEFEIHTPHDGARKDYIGNAAAHGRLATVFAQLEIDDESYGVHALLVPIRELDGSPCEGVRIADCGEKMGLSGVDNGRLWFDRVRIPRENLLDRFAGVSPEGEYTSPIASPSKRFFTMLGTLVGGRVSVALAGLSGAKSALAVAVRYAARRRQFGPAGEAEIVILDYLTHQRRLMPRLATTYALDFALDELVKDFIDSPVDERRDVEVMAAGLKAFSTWHATDTIQTCREACGGNGYLAVNRFAELKADTDVFTTFEGDNTVLLQLVAKGLLSGYKRQFNEMNAMGLVRYLAGRAMTRVEKLNPIVIRNTDEEHLRSDEFQLGALRWREEHLVASVARRLKKRIDAGMDSFQALIDCQDHVVTTAKAHVERVVLERFIAGVGRCEDEPLRAVLSDLVDLFALERIERDRGWFLENGMLEGPKAKAIRKQVLALCRKVRQQAVPLVDGFGIPDALLAAPIAVGDSPSASSSVPSSASSSGQ
ncbi:MAG: acyl-CoA dehydrogenase [Acidobacteriota bacterium]